ncbi:hypothetical protein BT69DRAFT_1285107 [Atractiella rhizophila]|nr:hypothetical protein BT69DRAFT_1285107 [Atractiella rhizophila]
MSQQATKGRSPPKRLSSPQQNEDDETKHEHHGHPKHPTTQGVLQRYIVNPRLIHSAVHPQAVHSKI